jgi:apolipoprotein N-acyltransferase
MIYLCRLNILNKLRFYIQQMTTFKRIPLVLASALLFSLAWYEWGSGLFLLVAFTPLLYLIDQISNDELKAKRGNIFLYSSLTFLVWNLLTTWWIKNASFAGMLAAVAVTTTLMSLPVMLYAWTRHVWGRGFGYLAFVLFWLAYEFAYNHGEISWPWLTLGNGFLFDIRLVQWYEYSGIFGGSLWVLCTNILAYETIRRYSISGRLSRSYMAGFALWVIIPVAFSLFRFYTYKEKHDPREIVVVQPNIDPYMKFNDIPSIEQTRIQVMEAMKLITPETSYIACPETSIINQIWINNMEIVPDFQLIRHYVELNPGVKYITGIMCRERYDPGVQTPTSKPLGDSGYFYDTFNSAIQIDTTPYIQIYHKSMLVTGVEKMPYSQYLGVLKKLMLGLGGTFRSHGTQKEREVFTASDDHARIAPVICWESVYGEFVGEYIELGANVIFVITNDGWWGNTPGHIQHNALSCLRAIETRRSIARSANTGISSFINQKGEILQSLSWWKRGALIDTLNLNDHITFYVKNGDYIGRGGFYLSMLLLLATFVLGMVKK